MSNTIQKSDDEWRAQLSPEQYRVLRQKGTEIPGTGELLYNDDSGQYVCAGCGNAVFSSDSKYESTIPGLIGWPSFSEALDNDAIEQVEDNSQGMRRVEVLCKVCKGHLGHIFPDDTSPTNQHFCINSAALNFQKKA